jgi:hypothetical protein
MRVICDGLPNVRSGVKLHLRIFIACFDGMAGLVKLDLVASLCPCVKFSWAQLALLYSEFQRLGLTIGVLLRSGGVITRQRGFAII